MAFAEFALPDRLDDFLQTCWQVFFWCCDRHIVFQSIYILYSCTKDEDVLLLYLLVDLHVCPVHCPDNKGSIQDEFHVAGTRSLSTC